MSQYFDNKQLFQTPETTQYGSHMVMTNVTPPTKVKYLNVDTRFSDDFNNIDRANYNIILPDRLTNIKTMAVTNIEIPVTYYNISASFGNNTFRVTDQSTSIAITITLPDGQYDVKTLTDTINAQLPTGLVYSTDCNGHSIFTSTGFDSFFLEFYTNPLGGFDKFQPKFKLGWLMGFRYVSYPVVSLMPLLSESPINLCGPRYMYLMIDEFQGGKENSFNSLLSKSMMWKNILARITTNMFDYPYGSMIPANLSNGLLTTDKRSYLGKTDIQRLNIQLAYENGNIVNLNGNDISFCLELEYE